MLFHFWTNDGHSTAHTTDSDILKPHTIQFGLRDDTVLGLRVFVSLAIMHWAVGLILVDHHILKDHNAFVFTVINNLSRTSQLSKKKALHSSKTLEPVNPIKQHSIPQRPESSTNTIWKSQITHSSWFAQSCFNWTKSNIWYYVWDWQGFIPNTYMR